MPLLGKCIKQQRKVRCLALLLLQSRQECNRFTHNVSFCQAWQMYKTTAQGQMPCAVFAAIPTGMQPFHGQYVFMPNAIMPSDYHHIDLWPVIQLPSGHLKVKIQSVPDCFH